MYRGIGNSMAVREKNIIGIFDLDNASWSRHTREFLRRAEKNGEVIPVSDDIPKSFILTQEYGLDHIYLVQFNTKTLEKRIENIEPNTQGLAQL